MKKNNRGIVRKQVDKLFKKMVAVAILILFLLWLLSLFKFNADLVFIINQIGSLHGDIQSLQTSVSALTEHANYMNTVSDAMSVKINGVALDMQTQQSSIESLATGYGNLNMGLDASADIQREVATYESHITELQGELLKANATLTAEAPSITEKFTDGITDKVTGGATTIVALETLRRLITFRLIGVPL